MVERAPTSPERTPGLNQAAAVRAEEHAIESHGDEKKAGLLKKTFFAGMLSVTAGAFLVRFFYKGLEKMESFYKGLAKSGGGGGSHGGGGHEKPHDSHGDSHGGGHGH